MRWAAMLWLSLCCVGCFVPGARGRLAFALRAPDEPLGIETPLAVAEHARAEVVVRRGGTPVHEIGTALSSAPDVFAIVSTWQDTVVIQALRAGEGRLRVLADGQADEVPFRVGAVAREDLVVPVAADGATRAKVAVLRGERARFSARAFDADGRRLWTAEPGPSEAAKAAGARRLPPSSAGRWLDLAFDVSGEVVLSTAAAPPLAVRVVTPDEVTVLSLRDVLPGPRASLIVPWVEVDGERLPLVSEGVLWEDKTPETCARLPSRPEHADEASPLAPLQGVAAAVVLMRAPGHCQIELRLGSRSTSFARRS